MQRSDLHHRLLAAHERGDGAALIALYIEAAEHAQDADAKGFYLTHAYVFALEAGDARAANLKQNLIDMGREVPG